jgi:hypothetical protein
MPDPLQEIQSLLRDARNLKHRQRYFGAMSSFLQAEKKIIAQLPPELRDGADEPGGPSTALRASTARALLAAGALNEERMLGLTTQLNQGSAPMPPASSPAPGENWFSTE